jgi:hypothetical protein
MGCDEQACAWAIHDGPRVPRQFVVVSTVPVQVFAVAVFETLGLTGNRPVAEQVGH